MLRLASQHPSSGLVPAALSRRVGAGVTDMVISISFGALLGFEMMWELEHP